MSGPARLIDFPTIRDRRGNLAVLEAGEQLPFGFGHVEWSYPRSGVQSGDGRESRTTEQLVFALSGSFDIVVDDKSRRVFPMNRPSRGLYIPPGLSHEIVNVSANAVRLVVRSPVAGHDGGPSERLAP